MPHFEQSAYMPRVRPTSLARSDWTGIGGPVNGWRAQALGDIRRISSLQNRALAPTVVPSPGSSTGPQQRRLLADLVLIRQRSEFRTGQVSSLKVDAVQVGSPQVGAA
jgi:hypothetical protein